MNLFIYFFFAVVYCVYPGSEQREYLKDVLLSIGVVNGTSVADKFLDAYQCDAATGRPTSVAQFLINQCVSCLSCSTTNGGHITEINFPQQELTGTIPLSVLYLEHLERLDLSDNRLTGPLFQGLDGAPDDITLAFWFAKIKLQRFFTLLVRNNQLTGPIPESVWAHTRTLEHLDLSGNRFSPGLVPFALKFLRSLQTCVLGRQQSSSSSSLIPLQCPTKLPDVCRQSAEPACQQRPPPRLVVTEVLKTPSLSSSLAQAGYIEVFNAHPTFSYVIDNEYFFSVDTALQPSLFAESTLAYQPLSDTRHVLLPGHRLVFCRSRIASVNGGFSSGPGDVCATALASDAFYLFSVAGAFSFRDPDGYIIDVFDARRWQSVTGRSFDLKLSAETLDVASRRQPSSWCIANELIEGRSSGSLSSFRLPDLWGTPLRPGPATGACPRAVEVIASDPQTTTAFAAGPVSPNPVSSIQQPQTTTPLLFAADKDLTGGKQPLSLLNVILLSLAAVFFILVVFCAVMGRILWKRAAQAKRQANDIHPSLLVPAKNRYANAAGPSPDNNLYPLSTTGRHSRNRSRAGTNSLESNNARRHRGSSFISSRRPSFASPHSADIRRPNF